MAWAKRIFLFVLTNILVIATISLILSFFGINGYQTVSIGGGPQLDYQSLMIFCAVWGGVGSLISLLISKQMAKWSMGVKVINPNMPNSHVERDLLNSVHQLARAAGLRKMPEVGIYQSPEVNAFATGPTRNNALVAVSTGLLHRMNNDAVEGVLGHEVAHIANGDMVTMALAQGVINAFVMFFARVIAFAVGSALRRGDDEGPSYLVQTLLVFALEIVFGLLGMIVVSAFSRYREFRADAGSARLGGRHKMITALEALRANSQMIDPGHESMAAFKISGKRGGFLALLSTHPPLEERIRRLQSA